jgi:S-adenosyl methyltransferase
VSSPPSPAAQIVAAFREQMPAGSYLAITQATAGNMDRDKLTEAVQTYASSSAGSITLRSPEQIAAFFDGLELEEPGVVPAAQWRPGTAGPAATCGPAFLGGLARKAGNTVRSR